MKTVMDRLIYVLQAPIFFVYMCIPFLWFIGLPYWMFTGRDLMKDWCKYNEI